MTRNQSTHRKRRHGYTLMEMLLVLAILLVLLGIAWPSVQGMYERNRLQATVEEVRAHLAGTRYRAVDKGVIYQFLYEPGGRAFYILPLQATDAGTYPAVEGTLPESFTFADPVDVAATAVQQVAAAQSTDLGNNTSWSAPILFSPDGSATEAAFDVLDDNNQYVRLSVRGLTSAVSVGPVLQRSTGR